MINIGIIKEYKIPNDYRVPFTPNQAKEIKELDGFNVVCQKSEIRCYKEEEYKEQGISIVNQLDESDVIFGIKEVPVNKLIENKTYFMFSHTIKKQPYNRDLLKTIIKKKIRLIDYECLTEGNKRIVAFGKYAGIAGTYNTLIAYGIKYKKYDFQRLSKFKNTKELYKFSSKNPLSDPIKILIIGNGRVAEGATELLEEFQVKQICTKEFISKNYNHPVYCQLEVRDYMKKPSGEDFEEQEYFINPENFKSNYKLYSNKTDILINAAYWDPKSPRLFEEKEIDDNFSAKIIGDISCDIDGAIPCTKKSSSIENPFFDYCNISKKIKKPFSDKRNITIMAIDNLPSELPRDSSKFFGNILKNKIIPLLEDDNNEILKEATITSDGSLTKRYKYLEDYVN